MGTNFTGLLYVPGIDRFIQFGGENGAATISYTYTFSAKLSASGVNRRSPGPRSVCPAIPNEKGFKVAAIPGYEIPIVLGCIAQCLGELNRCTFDALRQPGVAQASLKTPDQTVVQTTIQFPAEPLRPHHSVNT